MVFAVSLLMICHFACSRSQSHPGKWSTSSWYASAVANYRRAWSSKKLHGTFTTVVGKTWLWWESMYSYRS